MRLKRYRVVIILVVLLLVAAPFFLHAAPPDPDCDPLDPACPIDGGLSFLLAAGLGLGARRVFKKENR